MATNAQNSAKDDWEELPSGGPDDWEELGAERKTATPAPKEPYLKLGPITVENDPRQVDWGKALLKTFTKEPDPEAKAMFKTLGYAGGIVGDTGMELLQRLRSLGKEGLGAEEWKNALKGEAKSIPEHLGDMGYGPLVKYGAGLPLSAVSDPMGGFMSGAGYAAKPARAASVWNALKQVLPEGADTGRIAPIGGAIRKAGEKAYEAVFRGANKNVKAYRGAESLPDNAFSQMMWNGGDPLIGGFSKSNQEIADQATAVRKGKWDNLKSLWEDVPDVDLAPSVTEQAKYAGEQAAANEAERLHAFADKLEEAGKTDAADALRNQATDEDFLGGIARKAEDEHVYDFKNQAMESLKKGRHSRQDTVDQLKEIAPQFADDIEENAKRFMTGDRQAAEEWFTKFLDDVTAGPRSIDDTHALGAAYSRKAAGSESMGTNVYKKDTAKYPTKNVSAAKSRKTIDEILESAIDEAGAASPDAVKAAKQDYMLARRGEMGLAKTAKKADNAPVASQAMMFGLLEGLKHPIHAVATLGAKGTGLLQKSPRFGTGTGILLNNLGKSNIWDNMARRAMIDAYRSRGGDDAQE
jgi:hypothetical protein